MTTTRRVPVPVPVPCLKGLPFDATPWTLWWRLEDEADRAAHQTAEESSPYWSPAAHP